MVHQLSVSLEDLYNGTVRKLALQKNVICAKCEGELVSVSSMFCVNLKDRLHCASTVGHEDS